MTRSLDQQISGASHAGYIKSKDSFALPGQWGANGMFRFPGVRTEAFKGETMDEEKTIGKTCGRIPDREEIGDPGLIFDMPSCGGCRTCELACSFHHTEEFTPAASSIKILNRTSGPGYQVLLMAENQGKRIACDGCKELDVPLCMEYCREIDDLGKILLILEERKVQKKD
jgi:ferredoxin